MQIEERYLLYISEVYFPRDSDKTENLPEHTTIKLGSWNWLLARVHMRLSTTCFVGRRLSCSSFKLRFSFFYSPGENCTSLENMRILPSYNSLRGNGFTQSWESAWREGSAWGRCSPVKNLTNSHMPGILLLASAI